MLKRKLDVVVLSDIHLGTYGCHAAALNQYLQSIEPQTLILNGDFMDIGQSGRKSFPKEHMEVIHNLLRMAMTGTKVYYITGNYDDWLRQFSEFSMGNIHLRDKMVLLLNGKKYWIFHGDLFDASLNVSPLLARLGGKGYRLLIRINRFINKWRLWWGKERMSFVGKLKAEMSRSADFIQQFEETALKLAAQQNYDAVICGHLHQPSIRHKEINGRPITYMNSGDWVENLTALEYQFGRWNIYEYHEADFKFVSPRLKVPSSTTKSFTPKPLRNLNSILEDINKEP